MAKQKKRKIRVYFKGGQVDEISQKYWDDYEVKNGLFVVKKHGACVAFYSLDVIACMVVD